jgi:DNA repair protein SbcC/Rad50
MRFKEKAELEFPEGQVTLIEGENGAGKTSILDALCVCLYGRTLRTSGNTKSGYLQLSDLINHSSLNADLEVEFENHGHNFLVTKRLPGGSKTQLFEDGIVKAIGADEVVHYVEKVAIGLDWEAFTRSSVVLQGEMSTLSHLTPAQRRETLKKLFGLEKYDEYADIAKEKFDEAKRTIDILESANITLETDIEKIPETKKGIEESKKMLEGLQAMKERAEASLKSANTTRDVLEIESRKFGLLSQQATGFETTVASLRSSIETDEEEANRIKRIAGELPSLRKGYMEFRHVEAELNKLKPAKTRYEALIRASSTSSAIKLTKERDLITANAELVEREGHLKSLRKEIPSISAVNSVRSELEKLEHESKSINDTKSGFEGQLKVLSRSRTEIVSNKAKVQGLSTCPVCFQRISDPQEVLAHYSVELEKNRRSIEEGKSQVASASGSLRLLDVKISQAREKRQEVESRYAKRDSLPRAIAQVSQQKKKVTALGKEIVKLALQIRKTNDAIQKLGFDSEVFASAESSLIAMRRRKVVEHYIKAVSELRRLPALRRKLASQEKKKRALESRWGRVQKRLAALSDVDRRYKEAKVEASKAQEEFSRQDRAVSAQTSELRKDEELLAGLGRKEKLHKDNATKIESHQKQEELFQILRDIFRKIPEDVLRRIRPVIEAEGSEIVTSLSDNEITGINLEETNFMVSATCLGEVRPIEYYSGGQKTRINMALRIAISRILTKLPSTEEHTFGVMETLLIDEGDFGYLDEAGIRDAVESVRELTKIFSRVIIISHVDTFRELFHGNAVEVVKTGDETSTILSS